MSDRPQDSSGRRIVIGLAIVMAAGSLGYRVLVSKHLEQTAALFIGLPAVLAILVALTRPPKSATGVILKAMTLLLLLSGILLGEGFICIVMAAPLFYLVGFVIGRIVDAAEKRRQRRLDVRLYGLILLPFLPLSLEGVRPSLSFSRAEEVTVERTVPASAEAVQRSLESTPLFEESLPLFLRIRFPRPAAIWGDGLEPGAYRAIRFTEAEEPPGILVLRVSARSPGFVRFEAESDTSMIAHWLEWRSVDVRWESLSPGATRVRWTLRYERRLDPAWYFGPWERYAVRLAAGYLVETAATPAGGGPR
jgi:hypothetical protein